MFDWNRANETELLQTCRDAGISVAPGTPKDTLIKLLTGEVEEAPGNPVDQWRDALMEFLLDYWMAARCQDQGCPARELEVWTEKPEGQMLVRRKPGLPPDRIACRTCTDAQVLCCVIQNEPNAQLIEIRRKR